MEIQINSVRENPNGVEHKCVLCPYSTKHLGHYKQHEKTHSNEKPFKCPECPHRAKFKSAIKIHLKHVHDLTRPFSCSHPGCNYAAKQKSDLKIHLKTHLNEKSLFCSHPYCSYSTHRKENLKIHGRIHTGEKPWVCQFESCSYAAATSGELVNHTRIHTKEKPYKCPEPSCEYSTSQSSNLKTHGLTHEPKDAEEHPIFQCPICEYSSQYKGNLSAHIKGHTLEKPFACSFESCEYRCKQKAHLESHLKTHSEERQYKCELCPFRGKTRTVVGTHLNKVHSDTHRFKCPEPQCDYAAKQSYVLQLHLLTHSTEKTYACAFPDCGYRSIRKSRVGEHEYRIHSNEKKVKCAHCEFRCKIKPQLTIHMRTHTKEEPYKCKEPNCGYRGKSSSKIRQHQKSKQFKSSKIVN